MIQTIHAILRHVNQILSLEGNGKYVANNALVKQLLTHTLFDWHRSFKDDLECWELFRQSLAEFKSIDLRYNYVD